MGTSRAKQQQEIDRVNREDGLAGPEDPAVESEGVADDAPIGQFRNGGLTEGEHEEIVREPTATETRHQAAVEDAVARIRVYTSHLDDLTHRYDKGLPVTRTHIGDLKTHLDQIVNDLVDALGL